MRTDLQEETERQERCARGDAWRLAKNICKVKEKEKATFFSPTDELRLPAASTMKPEEREFVLDSGARMHMVSRKDLNSAESDTVKVSKSPTTVVPVNGEVLTKDEATAYVRELYLFVTVMLLEDTPAVLSLAKLCEGHGYTYHWTSRKPHLKKNGRNIDCNTANYVPFVVPVLSTNSLSSVTPTSPTSSSQEAVIRTQHPASTRSESTSGTERVRGDPSRGPAEIKDLVNNEDNEEVRGDSLHDLPEGLKEFKDNLVDESVPEHRDASSTSHTLPFQSREQKWHRVSTVFLLAPEIWARTT